MANITDDFENRGVHFLVTNAYHESIKQLYTTGSQIPISRSSTIGGKGATRTNYREIIITNTEI